MLMQTLFGDWHQNAEEHASINRTFLRSLDDRAEKAIDRTARRLHREAFAIVDWTRCANCCKTMIPCFTGDEARNIASHRHLDYETFVAAYFVRSRHDLDQGCGQAGRTNSIKRTRTAELRQDG